MESSIRRNGGRAALALVAGALLILTAAGCYYPTDRLKDLADISRVSLGPGLGLGVQVKATGYFHPSIGIATKSFRVGWDGRACFGAWPEAEAFFPASLWRTTIYKAATFDPLDAMLPSFYSRRCMAPVMNCDSTSHLFFSGPPGRNMEDMHTYWYFVSTLGDVEAGVSAIILSVRAGANVFETLDFVLGIFAIDIAGDDTPARRAREKD